MDEPVTLPDYFITLLSSISHLGKLDAYKNRGRDWVQQGIDKDYKAWTDAMKVIDVQRQHTSTHGVDLSDL